MADIRKLERETQLALEKKMNEDADRDSTVVLVSLGLHGFYTQVLNN